ncbi:hypothetical protein [Nitrosospira sp. Is2]|uniref:hypothetical protein n=1 Tax=Nitrosospira sp. Is2 TaxID=3080532 RepID=UPI00295368D2|nr:hypothetical protein [Nitrosospira sp. Is2]WON73560.1 hypothetical protein R5L00_13930 [Nitrosospira sp. Is2]
MQSISVPIPTEQFLEFVNFLQSNSDPRDPVEMVSTAIQYWLDNASCKPELLSEVSSAIRGYQWKNLFLPHGTQIRMQYRGTYSYAKVENDEVIYNGSAISPARLANTIAGGSRNAWHELWIKRPQDKEWKLADECRVKEEVVQKFIQELDDEFGTSQTERKQS